MNNLNPQIPTTEEILVPNIFEVTDFTPEMIATLATRCDYPEDEIYSQGYEVSAQHAPIVEAISILVAAGLDTSDIIELGINYSILEEKPSTIFVFFDQSPNLSNEKRSEYREEVGEIIDGINNILKAVESPYSLPNIFKSIS